MTDNVPPSHFEENTDPTAFPEQETTTPIEAPGQLDLEAKLTAMAAENQQIKDQMLRALAEAENTRRRAERDRDDASKFAISNFARNLLSVADNFRRALDSIPEDLKSGDARLSALIAGIEATERELLSAFDRSGIKKIPAMDQPFNANLHEVMFEAPGTGKPAGTIIQVIEDGYTIHDRLLRPTRVGVAKADPGAPTSGHAIDQEA